MQAGAAWQTVMNFSHYNFIIYSEKQNNVLQEKEEKINAHCEPSEWLNENQTEIER